MRCRKQMLLLVILLAAFIPAMFGCVAWERDLEQAETDASAVITTDTELTPSQNPQGKNDAQNDLQESTSILEEATTDEDDSFCAYPTADEFERMVMLDDKLYTDTGETSRMPRCGVMDFSFDSSIETGQPIENYQTNFGCGYEGQYGARSNRIEIRIEDTWHVFAYNENNLENVTMEVIENTNHSINLAIHCESPLDIQYGEEYFIEYYDEEIETWTVVPQYCEVAFHDIAYMVKPNGTNVGETTWDTDWTVIYGELAPGRYRIVKTFMDYRGPGDYTEYMLTAEFEVK